MRYTEARLAPAALALTENLDEDVVDFTANYDGRELEPTVLPAAIPNLLVNGSSGIAVGMATNMPPHNLRELLDATIYVIDNPEASVDDLLKFVQGPDFPTAGLVYDKAIEVVKLFEAETKSLQEPEAVERAKDVPRAFLVLVN